MKISNAKDPAQLMRRALSGSLFLHRHSALSYGPTSSLKNSYLLCTKFRYSNLPLGGDRNFRYKHYCFSFLRNLSSNVACNNSESSNEWFQITKLASTTFATGRWPRRSTRNISCKQTLGRRLCNRGITKG